MIFHLSLYFTNYIAVLPRSSSSVSKLFSGIFGNCIRLFLLLVNQFCIILEFGSCSAMTSRHRFLCETTVDMKNVGYLVQFSSFIFTYGVGANVAELQKTHRQMKGFTESVKMSFLGSNTPCPVLWGERPPFQVTCTISTR